MVFFTRFYNEVANCLKRVVDDRHPGLTCSVDDVAQAYSMMTSSFLPPGVLDNCTGNKNNLSQLIFKKSLNNRLWFELFFIDYVQEKHFSVNAFYFIFVKNSHSLNFEAMVI